MANRYHFLYAGLATMFSALLLPCTLPAQDVNPDQAGRMIRPAVSRSETFDRESVWNYHVGDADLYLEYGFRSLLVSDYRLAGRIFREEVYDLGSPLDAYGLFTCNRLNCELTGSSDQDECVTSSEYRLADSNRYILVSVLAGSDPGRDSMLYYSKKLITAMDTVGPALPAPFDQPNFRRVNNNMVYIRGQAGLRTSALPWQELMLGLQFEMYAVPIPLNGSDLLFARITFQESPLIMVFLERAGLMVQNMPVPNTNTADGLYREFQQIDDNTIFFLESQEPFPIDVLVNPER